MGEAMAGTSECYAIKDADSGRTVWRKSSGTLEIATASRMVTTAASVWRKSKDRGIAATPSKTRTTARRVWLGRDRQPLHHAQR